MSGRVNWKINKFIKNQWPVKLYGRWWNHQGTSLIGWLKKPKNAKKMSVCLPLIIERPLIVSIMSSSGVFLEKF